MHDWETPVLLIKMGHYPVHHGGLWIARDLGRLGVDVFVLAEDLWTPLAVSRFTKRVGTALLSGGRPEDVREALTRVCSLIPTCPVGIPTDDEAAIWLAEQRPTDVLLLPEQTPELPRRLADKASLAQICKSHGIASPATVVPGSAAEIAGLARSLRFPVVVKKRAAFAGAEPPIAMTAVLDDGLDLLAWTREHFDQTNPPLIQEYIPARYARNWIYQAYRSATLLASFTGEKLRDFPPHRGETTYAESLINPRLRALGDRLLTQIDYRGVCDLDFVHDARDGQYKLIDFNPRFGANAAMFRSRNGLNLARITYLDLTGQTPAVAEQVDHLAFRVEPRDRLAMRSYQRGSTRSDVTAYWARDDPLPAVLAQARFWRSAVLERR